MIPALQPHLLGLFTALAAGSAASTAASPAPTGVLPVQLDRAHPGKFSAAIDTTLVQAVKEVTGVEPFAYAALAEALGEKNADALADCPSSSCYQAITHFLPLKRVLVLYLADSAGKWAMLLKLIDPHSGAIIRRVSAFSSPGRDGLKRLRRLVEELYAAPPPRANRPPAGWPLPTTGHGAQSSQADTHYDYQHALAGLRRLLEQPSPLPGSLAQANAQVVIHHRKSIRGEVHRGRKCKVSDTEACLEAATGLVEQQRTLKATRPLARGCHYGNDDACTRLLGLSAEGLARQQTAFASSLVTPCTDGWAAACTLLDQYDQVERVGRTVRIVGWSLVGSGTLLLLAQLISGEPVANSASLPVFSLGLAASISGSLLLYVGYARLADARLTAQASASRPPARGVQLAWHF